MSISFGIPKREVVNKEVFPDNPVITLELVQDKGFNRRFSLNQSALELLQVIPGTSSVGFAFDPENKKVYIAKLNAEDSIAVGKNRAFSNKKYYEYISNMKELDNSKDNHFELTNPVDILGYTAYELVSIESITEEPKEPINIIEKEIEHLVEEEELNFSKIIDEEIEETIGDIPYKPRGSEW